MRLIGLTGGVACGKTTVSKSFEENGYPVIDADLIVRELFDKNADVIAKVEKEFGTKDRKLLREMVFSDTEKRRILERLMHPIVGDVIQERVAKLSRQKPAPTNIVLSIPLLFESNWEKLVDFTVAVLSKEENQVARLQKRDKIGADLAKQMVASQMPNSEKEKRAHYVIHNDGSLEALNRCVKKLMDELDNKPLVN